MKATKNNVESIKSTAPAPTAPTAPAPTAPAPTAPAPTAPAPTAPAPTAPAPTAPTGRALRNHLAHVASAVMVDLKSDIMSLAGDLRVEKRDTGRAFDATHAADILAAYALTLPQGKKDERYTRSKARVDLHAALHAALAAIDKL